MRRKRNAADGSVKVRDDIYLVHFKSFRETILHGHHLQFETSNVKKREKKINERRGRRRTLLKVK